MELSTELSPLVLGQSLEIQRTQLIARFVLCFVPTLPYVSCRLDSYWFCIEWPICTFRIHHLCFVNLSFGQPKYVPDIAIRMPNGSKRNHMGVSWWVTQWRMHMDSVGHIRMLMEAHECSRIHNGCLYWSHAMYIYIYMNILHTYRHIHIYIYMHIFMHI